MDTLVRRQAPRVEGSQAGANVRRVAAGSGSALADLVPAEITFDDSQGRSRTASVVLECTATPADLEALLRGVQDGGGATRVGLEASFAMMSILARSDLSALTVFRVGSGESLLGWILAVREPGTFEINVGPLRLFRARHQRLRLIGGYSLCVAEQATGGDLQAAAVRLLTLLRPKFMVIFQTVSPEDRLARIAQGLGHLPRFEQQYVERPRYAVRPAENFEAYLGQLNSKWRSTFRRSLRNFDAHFEGQTELRGFSREDEVTAFVDDAEKVSRRTWQWQESGRGLRDRAAVEARLRLAAQRGYFHSFVLYGRGEPLAFVEGFLAGGCYVPLQVGFVNELTALSVGTVCQLRLLRYLHELPAEQRPHFVDYMDGVEDWKRSMATVKTTETSYRVLPDGIQWGIASGLLRMMRLGGELKRWVRKAPAAGAKTAAWLLPMLPDDVSTFTELLY